MPTTPDDELKQRIEQMYRSCFQDGEAIALGRKSQDGSPWKVRIEDFTDMTVQLLADQRRRDAAAIKARVTDGKVPNDQYEASRRWRAAVDAVLLNDQGRSE